MCEIKKIDNINNLNYLYMKTIYKYVYIVSIIM